MLAAGCCVRASVVLSLVAGCAGANVAESAEGSAASEHCSMDHCCRSAKTMLGYHSNIIAFINDDKWGTNATLQLSAEISALQWFPHSHTCAPLSKHSRSKVKQN